MVLVNTKKERIESINEKRIQLLKTKFFVYESTGIQSQLTSRNRTITLNVRFCLKYLIKSIECSSSVLEHDKTIKLSLQVEQTKAEEKKITKQIPQQQKSSSQFMKHKANYFKVNN
ncbi:unnamed protein product [Rotaria sp. Silwood1]|nr:unnamed protein product [Rotaria sp. Silwood1]